MNFDEYQLWTRSTAVYPERDTVNYLVMGLVSEAGEVAGKRKKEIRDQCDLRNSMVQEIGDVLWYIARLTDELGISLSDLALANKEKLEDRKSRNVIGGSGDKR